MRVLFVVLSEMESEGGALPLGCFAAVYYALQGAGLEIVLASQGGGYLYLDNVATSDEIPEMQRFQADRLAREELSDTICVDDVHPEDFEGAICLGPPDPAATLPDRVLFLVSSLLSFGKPTVVIPESLAPAAGNGLLITANRSDAPREAAHALIGALKETKAPPQR